MAFQIGSGQTISHPYTVAFQTQLLEIEKGMKVLRDWYRVWISKLAFFVSLGAKVFSIERHKELHKKAKAMIDFFKFSARLFFGDGYKGNIDLCPIRQNFGNLWRSRNYQRSW